VDKKTSEQR